MTRNMRGMLKTRKTSTLQLAITSLPREIIRTMLTFALN
jgi:hypothetical protein